MRRVFVLRSILILFALYSFSTGAEPQNRTRAGKGKKGKRAGFSCYGQTGSENVQLVLHCCKTSWKAMLRMLPSRNQTCLATYQVAWILTSGWIQLGGTHVVHGGCVTCCKTSLPWAGKTRNMCTLLQNKELLSTFCQNVSELEITSFVARKVRLLGGNTRNNSLCTNVAKRTFLLSVSSYFYYGDHNPVSVKK